MYSWLEIKKLAQFLPDQAPVADDNEYQKLNQKL